MAHPRRADTHFHISFKEIYKKQEEQQCEFFMGLSSRGLGCLCMRVWLLLTDVQLIHNSLCSLFPLTSTRGNANHIFTMLKGAAYFTVFPLKTWQEKLCVAGLVAPLIDIFQGSQWVSSLSPPPIMHLSYIITLHALFAPEIDVRFKKGWGGKILPCSTTFMVFIGHSNSQTTCLSWQTTCKPFLLL